ncbi:SprT-like domain-containing protein [Sediminibacterium soli]|uniref:SprT-like domain-containing protein n=1 Tax=Sediminibacterium soli TaxID=2698829 RepID=UPI00137B3A08|nr:SprT-like domain-containing protein [Sediminibacterium soli]NCI46880.1 SprT family zinc-dependent metalloprotease [Sediminibacterium soli]
MPVSEHPMHALVKFLPEGSFDQVAQYLDHYKVHLTITKERRSVLGDYRHAGRGGNHRISINGNLNKYEFLITLLHELAHLLVFEQFRNRVEAHGTEWKHCYSSLLVDFVQQQVFPAEIERALRKSIINPAATANGETDLLLVLRRYDLHKKEGYLPVAELPEGALFQMDDGRLFRKGPKRRKRYECVEVKTGYRYTFSPVSEVRIVRGEST